MWPLALDILHVCSSCLAPAIGAWSFRQRNRGAACGLSMVAIGYFVYLSANVVWLNPEGAVSNITMFLMFHHASTILHTSGLLFAVICVLRNLPGDPDATSNTRGGIQYRGLDI